MTEQQLKALTDAMQAHADDVRRECVAITSRLEKLTEAVLTLTQQQSARLTRAELCERQGIHRNTLLRRLKSDRRFPRPGSDGKWSAAEVLRWELAGAPVN